ncbi:DUF4190 domain-containing protein [Mycobacterium sp. 21AC1]|uniref:DUF4190 domain-containing protein n=1 Tax=[Mycobacterium] appelbergii TaxID=2939269 RepID=UPI002939216F|nr:DUF4190 domain-containing protein [Mycobacterium sp. 21AC1]MDV3124390.1 DUF4190 domain-containing protein [Mycobacterium sp. 21AC1]
MTNPDGNAGETPPSGPGAGPSEPSWSGYEAPPIEQSQDQPPAAEAQPPYPSYAPYPSFPPPNYPSDYPPPPPGYPVPYPTGPQAYDPSTPLQYPAAPGYPPQAYPPPPGYPAPGYPPGYPGQPAANNGMAIGSLVASAAGIPFFFFCFTGIVPALVGIALGIVALNQIGNTGQAGRGLAIAGIALGAVVSLITVVFFLAFIASV